MSNQNKLGLVAGYGNLPFEIINAAEQAGYEISCVALQGMAADNYQQKLTDVLYVALGDLSKTIDFFRTRNIKQIFFAGKIFKTELFNISVQMDPLATKLLKRLKIKNDDAILVELVHLFAEFGIEVLDSTVFLKNLLPEEGLFTSQQLSAEMRIDVDFGCRIARAIAGLDIGQTVVVKNGVVLAVEAIEGTDAAILRGGELGQKGAVVVKVAKPHQDFRFDVPTIGPDTIDHCIQAGIAVLAIESGSTIFLNRELCLKKAADNGINIISLSLDESI